MEIQEMKLNITTYRDREGFVHQEIWREGQKIMDQVFDIREEQLKKIVFPMVMDLIQDMQCEHFKRRELADYGVCNSCKLQLDTRIGPFCLKHLVADDIRRRTIYAK